jgi:enoyl-CoA hydratase/carnithine racemase
MKRTLNEIACGALDEAAAYKRHLQSFAGDELKEGAAAFAEKRPPRF